MADEKKDQQFLGIAAQYIKDLSFENISSASQLATSESQPNIDIQLKVEVSKNNNSNTHVVSLITNIQAQLTKPLFIMDLNYTGEFVIEGFSDAQLLTPILYVECPRLLFPFARSIIANTVADGGFPPLYLAPVNFVELFQQQQGNASGQTIQ